MRKSRKRIGWILMSFCLSFVFSSCNAFRENPPESEEPTDLSITKEGVYLGIQGYGVITKEEVLAKGAKVYRFSVDGEEQRFSIGEKDSSNREYQYQNSLRIGETYDLTLDEDEIVSLSPKTSFQQEVNPIEKATPGQRTIKNFLQTAVGASEKVLYIYGGGWDFQDQGSGWTSQTFGMPVLWENFLKENIENYQCQNEEDKEHSVYPFGGYNAYHYAGLDCSGFMGWAVYNTLGPKADGSGYVVSSSRFAKTMEEQHYGIRQKPETPEDAYEALLPGDIVSMKGHTYAVVGKCEDGSLVIIHSSPIRDKTNTYRGGGVHLAALSPNGDGDTSCEAYRLVATFLDPNSVWSKYYNPSVKDLNTFLTFEAEDNGIFHWTIGPSGLEDPEDFIHKTAKEILEELQ